MTKENEEAGSGFVYIHSEEQVWTPARLLRTNAKNAKVELEGGEVRTVDLSDYPNNVLPLQNVNETGELNEVEDMVQLPFLHEVRKE